MEERHSYPGQELELFRDAVNWKRYFANVIAPYIHGKVLENGAGIGGTTLLLHNPSTVKWVLAEPDPKMSALLEDLFLRGELPANCTIHNGTIDSIAGTFDSIIYIDVLEHIEKDAEEIHKASSRLAEQGHLIVLSPAFRFLYSPFDKAIGHHRRYTRKTLQKLQGPELHIVHLRYYDTMGYFAGLMNKLLLKQKYPTKKQVRFWDRWLVPVSRITDRIFFHAFGKAVIAVWQKTKA